MNTKFITNEELYKQVILPVSGAEKFVWIGTSDIKDLHVQQGRGTVSFLAVLDSLLRKGVAVRLIHAKEPGPIFRESYEKYPLLWDGMERVLCPRVHFKHIIIDGTFAYTGSANLTGAGLGMKSSNRRNFEGGIVTSQPDLVEAVMDQFDQVWMGKFCKTCGRRDFCGDPII